MSDEAASGPTPNGEKSEEEGSKSTVEAADAVQSNDQPEHNEEKTEGPEEGCQYQEEKLGISILSHHEICRRASSASEGNSCAAAAAMSSDEDVQRQANMSLGTPVNLKKKKIPGRETTSLLSSSSARSLFFFKKSSSIHKIGHYRNKYGVTTYKETPTNTLMCSIQLGLHNSIGGLASKPILDLLMVHFNAIDSQDFPTVGTSFTPAHDYGDFTFKTYAPLAFRHFRAQFGIDVSDFMISICNEALRELSNPGASGSIFYLTHDDEFIMKTVQRKESKFLQHLLPGYYMNLIQNKQTLLPKFFGLYCYENLFHRRSIRIVVMNNLLPSCIAYHEKYDLKGSTFKRFASPKERTKKSPTLKDLDFLKNHPDGLLLEPEVHISLMESIRRDTTLLESFAIMDYSMLLGVHNIDEELRCKKAKGTELAQENMDTLDETPDITSAEESEPTGTSEASGKNTLDVTQPGASTPSTKRHLDRKLSAPASAVSRRKEFSLIASNDDSPTRYGDVTYDVPPGGIPAQNSNGDRLLLFIGIIDVLQSYELRKKMEHSVKSLMADGDTVSVHRPSFYATRFRSFMTDSIFKCDVSKRRSRNVSIHESS
ncbi:phosphatidylinositol 4-phosphate 5-kinase type-1 alpha-like [Sycon ciliatum]|uniref:phosphatidylinositol 4-phosphate 5-kinase type-1 alpha-like n=1 Tax=Sycon ciliatum TaxID=27933 RepID=UPI0020AA572D|eukprot:scpid58511/ scgid31415/ Phosphatidylinositol 4-phosphate 5-kinase type-1 alpha; 68 kDa type I phosphatidylinositol 4-phosphate 5-kinase; Phosphatidylinositol 4-phosphate 5-kinase type I alpha; Phosphatidylinositol 4-phosphate 5-kinase type I beta